MADVVSSQVYDGVRNFRIKLTNVSDGTGEVLVKKVDVTTLIPNPGTHLQLRRIQYSIAGGGVALYWEGTPNVPIMILSEGNGEATYQSDFAYPDNAMAPTGNVLLSTSGFIANSAYSIEMNFIKGISVN